MKKRNFSLVCLFLFAAPLFTVLHAYTISGFVIPGGNVILNLSGDASMTAVPDNTGYYEFTGLTGGGTYCITPARMHAQPQIKFAFYHRKYADNSENIRVNVKGDAIAYQFTPPGREFAVLDADWTNQDFSVTPDAACFAVKQVDFEVDNTLLYSDTRCTIGEAVYTYLWDTTTYLMGLHKIRVTATDEKESKASAEISLLIWSNNNRINGIIPGDVNADGLINIVDALMTAQYAVNLQPVNFHPEVADVDYNGKITILDALIILDIFFGPL